MKRLTVVVTIAAAMLFGAPRPASAQFSWFMEWLNSLDPGGFYMGGYHFDLVCLGDAGKGGFLAPTDKAHFCTHKGIPERSRIVFGIEPSYGEGKRNLAPNPGQRLQAFSLVGTAAVNYRFGLQFNAGLGFMRFWDPYAGTSNGMLRYGVGWSPVVAFSKKPKATATTHRAWLDNVQFRLSATTFFREFQPTDFGAPPGPGFGHHETTLTLGVFIGKTF